jgi:hypothetical protein
VGVISPAGETTLLSPKAAETIATFFKAWETMLLSQKAGETSVGPTGGRPWTIFIIGCSKYVPVRRAVLIFSIMNATPWMRPTHASHCKEIPHSHFNISAFSRKKYSDYYVSSKV